MNNKDFKIVLNSDIAKNKLLLGYNDDGNLLIDINKYPSIIITGETGSGKSILLDQIILQMIHKYTSFQMGIIPIDTSGVELNYYIDTSYTLISAINDMEKAVVAISRVLKEIDRRKEIIEKNGYTNVLEYNKHSNSKLPLILVAIDDDKHLLRNPDMEKMLTGIISQIPNLNILFVLSTSDVHNKFFEFDRNAFASLLISFDYTNSEEAKKANIKGANNLALGEYLAKKDGKISKYKNFEFDDKIITEVLSNSRFL